MRPMVLLTLTVLFLHSGPRPAPAEEPTPTGVRSEVRVATPATPAVPHEVPLADTEITTPGLAGVVDLQAAPAKALTPEERERRAELTASMHTELAALHAQTLELSRDLDTRSAKTVSAEALQQVDRELASLKEHEQIEALRIQARYAREVGSDALSAARTWPAPPLPILPR